MYFRRSRTYIFSNAVCVAFSISQRDKEKYLNNFQSINDNEKFKINGFKALLEAH